MLPGAAPGEPAASLAGRLVGDALPALLPALPDRARLREAASALAGAALGRPVRIAGPVSLSLVPEPTLSAADVLVPDQGDGVTLSARTLTWRLALAPLLSGRVEPREVLLRGASLRLPWPLPPAPALRALSGLVVRVEDGSLAVGGLRAEALEGTFSAGAAAGGEGMLAAAGTLRLGGRGWRVTARLGAPDGQGAATLALSLDGLDRARDNGLRLDGALAADGTVSGALEGGGPDLSRLLPAPPVAWHAAGPLSLSARRLAAGSLLLTLAGAPARAAVAFVLDPAPRLDLSLDLGRLDVDSWLPLLPRAGDAALPVALDLRAEAADALGATLHDLRLVLDLGPDGVRLRLGGAVLPGGAALRLSGRLDPPPAWRFSGEAALEAADLRPLRRWLAPLASALDGALPPGALRAASLRAAVAAAPGRVALTGLSGRLDGAALSGGLALRLPPAPAPPGITAELQLRGLRLDPFLPVAAPDGAGPGPQAAAALREAARRFCLLEGTLRLDLPGARLGEVPVDGLSLEAALGPHLVLRRLQGVLAGAQLSAGGELAPDGALSGARVELAAPDAAALLPLLPPSLRPPAPETADSPWHHPLAVVMGASGPPSALALRLRAAFDDGRLEFDPVLDLPAGRGEGALTLRHPGARRLLALLDGGTDPAWLGEGSLALVAHAAMAPGRVALDGLDLVAGALRARGALRLEPRPGGGRLAGELRADVLPVPLPSSPSSPSGLPPLPAALPAGWEGTLSLSARQVLAGEDALLQDAAAELVLDGTGLRLDHLAATLDGGRLEGVAALSLPAGGLPVVTLGGSLRGADAARTGLPLSGRLDARASLAATGHGGGALLSTLSGTASLEVTDGLLHGLDLPALDSALAAASAAPGRDAPPAVAPDPDPAASGRPGVLAPASSSVASGARPSAGADPFAAVAASLAGGQTPFARLAAEVAVSDGVATLRSAALEAPSGRIDASGGLDLFADRLDLHLLLRPAAPGLPPVGLRLQGSPAAERRAPELAALTLWLAGRTPAASAAAPP